eukprot:2237434-Prymnesium_polylepis.1
MLCPRCAQAQDWKLPEAPVKPLSEEELKALEMGDTYGVPDDIRAAARAVRQGCQALPGGARMHKFSLHREGMDSWSATCHACEVGMKFAELSAKQRKKAAKAGEQITTGLLQLHLQDRCAPPAQPHVACRQSAKSDAGVLTLLARRAARAHAQRAHKKGDLAEAAGAALCRRARLRVPPRARRLRDGWLQAGDVAGRQREPAAAEGVGGVAEAAGVLPRWRAGAGLTGLAGVLFGFCRTAVRIHSGHVTSLPRV